MELCGYCNVFSPYQGKESWLPWQIGLSRRWRAIYNLFFLTPDHYKQTNQPKGVSLAKMGVSVKTNLLQRKITRLTNKNACQEDK